MAETQTKISLSSKLGLQPCLRVSEDLIVIQPKRPIAQIPALLYMHFAFRVLCHLVITPYIDSLRVHYQPHQHEVSAFCIFTDAVSQSFLSPRSSYFARRNTTSVVLGLSSRKMGYCETQQLSDRSCHVSWAWQLRLA